MRKYCFLLLFEIFITSCDNPCTSPIKAYAFLFDISDSANDDIFSQQYLGNFSKDSVMIFHKDASGIHNDDVMIRKDPDAPVGKNVYLINIGDVEELSLEGIKTFYFRRNLKIIDTIVFNETNIKDKGGCNNFVLHSFTYNGVDLTKTGDSIMVKH